MVDLNFLTLSTLVERYINFSIAKVLPKVYKLYEKSNNKIIIFFRNLFFGSIFLSSHIIVS